MLELQDFSVRYPDGFVAVRGVELTVKTGETVALLGASGSGKSSLLRGIAGLEETTGSARINGVDITHTPTHKRGVGMVFQDGQLFPTRNVGRNIAYGIEKHLPAAQVREEVARWLAIIGLEGYERRPITTLSGGQAQRVALARALAPAPRVVLLDEPLSALDTQLRGELAVFIRQRLAATGTTAVYVTHNEEEAETVAGRVLQMRDGELWAQSPDRVD
ncbi:thiamine transport system ATP-binding protein [Actinobaculum suis]|uniref:ABC transporter ATP-binding protein n=1 Tax=Actinobaculum suis TaxID=1657 RepID=A0A1G7CNN8_9ACTO|nr:ABC transporter ATP-binding protein [Actinobaculum suis]MDY5152528.1 ABC transporter ATP-binding protein [Actinobaculum suis]SDE40075.1 thiamine transport system ATP-binding protein [Actinobaculum suis]